LDQGEVRRIASSIGGYPTDHETAFGSMSDVKEEDVEWVGYPYLIRGATTVLDGNPGQGKSTFVTAIAAAITAGRKLPFMPDLKSGPVLILSAEDDPARVLKPRLLAHDADISRVRFQKEPFTLDERGLSLLRAEIERHRPILVVVDPLIAYMDSDTDLHKANDTMRFMVELDFTAREFDLAMLVVRHLRKSEADDPLHRGLGSIAISARVRSLLILGRHPDDRDIRAVAQAKCSYAPEGPTILFKLVPTQPNKPPMVTWAGTDRELTAEALLSKPQTAPGRPDAEREAAKRFLSGFLDDGPQSKSKIDRAAKAHSVSPMTLRRAADDIGVSKQRDGRKTVWVLGGS
jgi:AAA domain